MSHTNQPLPATSQTDNPSSEVRLAKAMEEYLQAIETGGRPMRDEFLARYDDIAEPLAEALDALDFLDQVTPQLALPDGSAESPGPGQIERSMALGDFRLIREIGRGGMGIVYEAEQLSLSRHVALKVLPFAAMLDARQLQRFKTEARAAGMLKHPNIVSVYSVGCERGVHYYAMELVEGWSLAEVIANLHEAAGAHTSPKREQVNPPSHTNPKRERGNPPSTSLTHRVMKSADDAPKKTSAPLSDTHPIAALSTAHSSDRREYYRNVMSLVIQVAHALHYAHEQGIIHRDIKPSNLLIDLTGKLWITDFGLAQIQGDHNLTMTGDVLGTLRYMSPEQAEGRKLLDHRTDVFSLGLVLYELLTLRPAFDGDNRLALLRQITEDEPLAPRTIEPRITRDLETIILTAIAKRPEDRYVSALALAEDLQRLIEHRPIAARRVRSAERLWRWARRNRLVATLGVTVALLASVLSVAGPLVAVHERSIAQEALVRNYTLSVAGAYDAWEDGHLRRVHDLLASQIPEPGQRDPRGFEWHHLWGRYQRAFAIPSAHHPQQVLSLAYSADGETIATASQDRTVRLWDAQHLSLRHAATRHTDSVLRLAYSPDGRLLATGSLDHTIKLWDAHNLTELATLRAHEHGVGSLAFSPDGTQLASGDEAGNVFVWLVGQAASLPEAVGQVSNLPTQPTELLRGSEAYSTSTSSLASNNSFPAESNRGGQVTFVTFSPRGDRLAICHRGQTDVWRLSDGQFHAERKISSGAWSVAFSPDGQLLAVLATDVELWDTTDWKLVDSIPARGMYEAVSFSPDGRILAVGGNRTLVWQLSPRRLLATLTGHQGNVRTLAFSPDGKTLATGSIDFTVKLWNQQLWTKPARSSTELEWTSVMFAGTPPHQHLVVSMRSFSGWNERNTLSVLHGDSHRQRRLLNDGPPWNRIACSPTDPNLIAVAGGRRGSGVIMLWDRGESIATLSGHSEPVWGLAFSSDGQRLASASFGGIRFHSPELKLWDVPSRREIASYNGFAAMSLAFSSDGRTLAAGGGDWGEGIIQLFELGRLEPTERIVLDDQLVTGVCFTRDGQRLVIGDYGARVTVFDIARNEPCLTDRVYGDSILGISVSPCEKTLAAACASGCIRMWHIETGRQLGTLPTESKAHAIAFSPDGETLAATCSDSTVTYWHRDGRKEVITEK